MNHGDFVVGSHPIQISSSSPTPVKLPFGLLKGKDPLLSPSPFNSPAASLVNKFDSDIDLLLYRNSSVLEPLTIHKPSLPSYPSISPNSTKNITVRKKQRGGSCHFRGRSIASEFGVRNLSLVEVPILVSSESQPLRECMAGESSK